MPTAAPNSLGFLPLELGITWTHPLGFTTPSGCCAQGGAQHPSTSNIRGLCCLCVSPAGSKLGQTEDQPEFFLLPEPGPSPAELHAEGQLAVRPAGDPLRLAAVSPDPAGDVHLGQAWKQLGTHTDM